MKNTKIVLIACIWLMAALAATAAPTMSGRVKSYANGVLKIEQEDKSIRSFLVTDKTSVKYMGRNASVAALPAGAKISIEVIGSLGANPLKAGKIVDWSSSSEIVAVSAKSPYYTPVGQYASTNGTGGVPDGAPVGQHAASHTLGAVAHGGAINSPTMQNHPVGPSSPSSPNAHSTMGQTGSEQYINQGQSMSAPLEMQGINPYGGQAQGAVNPAVNPGSHPSMGSAADPSLGMYPGMDPSMMGVDPSLGMNPAMNPAMDPSMMGMDPSLGMSNPYAQSNLGTGQSGSLMGINGDEDGDYSASGDMMGIGESGYGSAGNKITGSILQVDLQRGFLMIQSFTNPQPQRVLMGPNSSASPDLLIPGKMIEITGRPTVNGFQAFEIQAASGF